MGFQPKLFTAEIRDDGLGLREESISGSAGVRRATRVMYERADELGGRLTIASIETAGAVERLLVPSRTAYDLPRSPADR